MNTRTWTRREFSQALALAATGSALGRASAASLQPGLVIVGSKSSDGEGALHVFRTLGDTWSRVHTVPAASPAHLVKHPSLPVLYVVHDVAEWNHLPRGAVSTYRFDREAARLDLRHTQPLSLAATRPRHAVLTANATHLFVAAEGGGIYNLLPLAGDGTLLPACAVRKEFGMEEDGVFKPAAPNSVALLPDGTLLAADAGQEQLTSFAVEGGLLTPRHRTRVHRGEGPARLTLSSDGNFAYTAGAARGTLRRHRIIGGKASDEVVIDAPRPSLPAPALAHVQDALSVLLV